MSTYKWAVLMSCRILSCFSSLPFNDEYQQTEARLAELYDEWERAETTQNSYKTADLIPCRILSCFSSLPFVVQLGQAGFCLLIFIVDLDQFRNVTRDFRTSHLVRQLRKLAFQS